MTTSPMKAKLEYWKEAQVASTQVLGPFTNTITGVVVGVEPMDLMIEGFEERLSKGVLPVRFVFFSAPGSAYEGFRPPTANFLIESSEKMASILLRDARTILQAAQHCGPKGAFPGSGAGDMLTFPISLLFDEFSRRVQEKLSVPLTEVRSPDSAGAG